MGESLGCTSVDDSPSLSAGDWVVFIHESHDTIGSLKEDTTEAPEILAL